MNSIFAVSIVLVFSLGLALGPLSNIAFAPAPQANEELTFQKQSPGFESSPSELIPGGDFSESSEFDSPLELEPPGLNLPDVNGTYVNPQVGLKVDLPEGWNGKEISFLMDSVIAAPQGIDLEATEEPGTVMTIQVIDKETFNELAGLAQSLGLEVENPSQAVGGDPLAMGGGEGEQCKELPASFITINGIKAEHRSGDCTDEEGSRGKIRGYTFATADGTIILLALSSNSTSEYNQYLPEFEQSVKTIKIESPGDIATSELYKKHKELEMQRQNNGTVSEITRDV